MGGQRRKKKMKMRSSCNVSNAGLQTYNIVAGGGDVRKGTFSQFSTRASKMDGTMDGGTDKASHRFESPSLKRMKKKRDTGFVIGKWN